MPFSKLRKIALEQDAAPLLLSALAAAVLAVFAGGLSASTSCLLVVVMGLQILIKFYHSLYEKAVPIEWLKRTSEQPQRCYAVIALGLAVLPLINGLAGQPGWWLLLLFFLYFAKPLRQLAVRIRQRNTLWKQHLAALREHGALIAVHVSGSVGAHSAYQINQWLPVLEKLGAPTIVLIREREIFTVMAHTALPVVYARNAAHVEEVLDLGTRTVLYPANPMKNLQLFRHYRLNHFFINHGESDKAVNQSKLLMAYDRILVGGPLAERRLRNAGLPVRPGQVIHVGRPQAEMLLRERRADAGAIRTILYAPTWEGFKDSVDYSSIGRFSHRVLRPLWRQSDYKILFKPHPYVGLRDKQRKRALRELRQWCQEGGHEFIDPESAIHEAMNRSDLLITDVSSVLNDYLVTGKPIVLCLTPNIDEGDLHTLYPSSRAAYSLPMNGASALDLIHRIADNDPLADERERVRRDSLGDFEGGALARFIGVVDGSVR